jgi:predicted CXXCH cytochrome family protein
MKQLAYITAIFIIVIVHLQQGFSQSALVENKCLECHAKTTAKPVQHSPVTLNCGLCHVSNGKEHPVTDEEGFKLVKQVPDLCFSCHDQSSIMKEEVHPPLKEGDCLSCHDVHSSKNEHLISSKTPALCYSCHNDLETAVTESKVPHKALLEGNSCTTCHSPHSSSEKKILVKPQTDLCLSCHNKEIKTEGRTLSNMKVLIERSKNVHGAIDNNGCTACHNPHASNNNYLLQKPFPLGNYSPAEKNTYDLCMECHEKSLYEDEKTTESTGFRNGENNLHFLHVNKDKGRTCLNCHNPHASNKLFLIAEKVKFGSWDMPINYNKLPKGGTCAPGCHGEKTYTR